MGIQVYTELSGHIVLEASASHQSLIRAWLMENVSHLNLISIILYLIYMQHHYYLPQKIFESTVQDADFKTPL